MIEIPLLLHLPRFSRNIKYRGRRRIIFLLPYKCQAKKMYKMHMQFILINILNIFKKMKKFLLRKVIKMYLNKRRGLIILNFITRL